MWLTLWISPLQLLLHLLLPRRIVDEQLLQIEDRGSQFSHVGTPCSEQKVRLTARATGQNALRGRHPWTHGGGVDRSGVLRRTAEPTIPILCGDRRRRFRSGGDMMAHPKRLVTPRLALFGQHRDPRGWSGASGRADRWDSGRIDPGWRAPANLGHTCWPIGDGCSRGLDPPYGQKDPVRPPW